jgi:hypothetical protein
LESSQANSSTRNTPGNSIRRDDDEIAVLTGAAVGGFLLNLALFERGVGLAE